jgi:hypothetical protein
MTDINAIRQQIKELMVECAKECGAMGIEEGKIIFSGADSKEKVAAFKKLFEQRRQALLRTSKRETVTGMTVPENFID